MDGKNRAASSYLSPGNPPADKEQNDPLAQVFHNACSYNFFAMAELLHRLAKGEKGTPELSLRDDPAQETLRFSADASLAFPCSDIEPDQQNSLGSYSLKNGEKLAGRSVLGNFVLGTRVPDLSGKFQLSITSLTRKQFLSFLPSGENFLPLPVRRSRIQMRWKNKLMSDSKAC